MENLIQKLAQNGHITLTVRARPGAGKNQIKEILADGSVKIDIAAAPEDGAANEELVRFLAEEFGVSKTSVTLVSGATARQKVIRISAG